MHIGATLERQPQFKVIAKQPHFRGYPQSPAPLAWHLSWRRCKLSYTIRIAHRSDAVSGHPLLQETG